MRILVLGGNGFIGIEIARRLVAVGHETLCVGRNIDSARARLPGARWIATDIASLSRPQHWTALLEGVDAIVNAAGALQDGSRDDLEALASALLALYEAAEPASIRIVQISARTDGIARDTAFLATKRAMDKQLAKSGLPHCIIRPALVIGRNAHGGTALIRALASMTLMVPVLHGQSLVAITGMEELAALACEAAEGELALGRDVAIAAPDPEPLADIIMQHRAWLGLPPARALEVPPVIARVGAWMGDIAGHFGWRSPMRTTAISVLAGGVTMDRQRPLMESPTLAKTLARYSPGVQDLWFGRLYLLKPVLIVALAGFWIASGLLALISFDSSSALLRSAGFSSATADLVTIITSVLDCLVGAAVLWRSLARPALLAMIATSLAYLAFASLLAPQFWLDPLGPLVKVIPAIFVAMVALAIIEER
ncbi:MAG: SDR family oxidoreductase [Rhizobiaceae bacterium]